MDIETFTRQQRKLQLLKARKELRRDNGLSFYRPHKKQALFHAHGDKKYRYARTGNRFGKSDMGAAEDVSWCVGARLWLPENHPDRHKGIPKRPVKGLVSVVDWDKSTEIFTSMVQGNEGKIFSFLPKNSYVTHHKNHTGSIDRIVIKSVHGGESVLCFDTVKSFTQNPMSQESSQWDFFHADEPIPEDMWKAVSRGLMDTDGSAWFLCTPLNEPWINDFFIPSMRQVLKQDDVNLFDDKVVIVGSTGDNPYLSKKAIEAYEATLTYDEQQCRIHGKPLAYSGLVYKQFDFNKHVYRETPPRWKDVDDPPKDYTIYYALDPHGREPHAVLFAAVAPSGEVFFFQELFLDVLLDNLCERITEVISKRFVVRALCDPLAYHANPVDRTVWADTFFEHGLYMEKATKDPCQGIRMTQQALSKPGLLNFGAHLGRTLWEFEHYLWDVKRSEKPKDGNDHMMENLYRLVLTELPYVLPPGPEPMYFPQVKLARHEVKRSETAEKKAAKRLGSFNSRYKTG